MNRFVIRPNWPLRVFDTPPSAYRGSLLENASKQFPSVRILDRSDPPNLEHIRHEGCVCDGRFAKYEELPDDKKTWIVYRFADIHSQVPDSRSVMTGAKHDVIAAIHSEPLRSQRIDAYRKDGNQAFQLRRRRNWWSYNSRWFGEKI